MVKVRGQNSNRNMVKKAVENGQKISSEEDAAVMSLVPGVKNSSLQNGLEFDRAYLGLQWQVAHGVTPTDHENFESLA